MADPLEKSKQFGDTIKTVEDLMQQPLDEHSKSIVKEMIKDISDERKEMESIATEALDSQNEGGDILFNTITAQLDRVEALRTRFEVWSVGSPRLSATSSHRGRGGHDFVSGGGSQVPGPSPQPPFVPPTESDDQPTRPLSDGSNRRKKNKKDKKLESGGDTGIGACGDSAWGAPPPGSAWGDTVDWGTSIPPAPTGGFGDDGFGGRWGSAPEHCPSDSRNNGFPSSETRGGIGPKTGENVTSGWASESSSHHKERHGGSTHGSCSLPESQHATLQIRRPFAEIERDVDGFKTSFRNSIAHAMGIPAHRIQIKQVQPGS